MSNHKFELIWAIKENQPKLVLRILPVGTAKPYHAEHRVTDSDLVEEIET